MIQGMRTGGQVCRLAAAVAVACGVAADAAGRTFHVSPAGDDSHAGEAGSPLRQIRAALARVSPGDTVRVADGRYLGFTASGLMGTSNAPIVIVSDGTGAWVDPTTDRSDNRDNIFVTFCSYLTLDGLNSSNAPRAAVRVDQSPRITVRNGRFGPNATWGIFTDFSDDLRIENNECFGSRTQHGIYTSNSGDRPVIRGNRCHDNAGCGIHMNGDLGAGGDGIISGAVVENNVVWNNSALGGSGINMDGVQDAVVRNNLLYGNHATGIAMFRGNGAAGPRGNLVAHNTIDQAADARWALLIGQAAGTNTVRNNILHQRNTAHVRGCVLYGSAADAGLTDAGYNAWSGNAHVSTDDGATRHNLAAWQAAGHEPHSIGAEIANLVVAAPGDYRLKAGSPAIDAGQTLPRVVVDLEWRTRPAGPASDMGAHEFGAQLAPPRFRSVEVEGPAVRLGFTSLPGRQYRVEAAEVLHSGSPTTVEAGIVGTGDVVPALDADGGTRSARFYRVRMSP
jgi:parallel beta-helix repeat protein